MRTIVRPALLVFATLIWAAFAVEAVWMVETDQMTATRGVMDQ